MTTVILRTIIYKPYSRVFYAYGVSILLTFMFSVLQFILYYLYIQSVHKTKVAVIFICVMGISPIERPPSPSRTANNIGGGNKKKKKEKWFLWSISIKCYHKCFRSTLLQLQQFLCIPLKHLTGKDTERKLHYSAFLCPYPCNTDGGITKSQSDGMFGIYENEKKLLCIGCSMKFSRSWLYSINTCACDTYPPNIRLYGAIRMGV